MPVPGRLRRRRPHEREQFGVPIRQPNTRPSPEVLPWYWHPDRDGVGKPPEAVAKQLAELDPDLRVCFSPPHERWLIWVKNDRIGADPKLASSWLCRGWQLLMIWERADTHAYLPIDGEYFALLCHNLVRIRAIHHPSAVAYFEKIEQRVADAKAVRERQYENERQAQQGEMRDSFKISTAAPGNRSALHHSGTIVPSQGEANWRKETRKWRLPPEALKQEQDEKEKARHGR